MPKSIRLKRMLLECGITKEDFCKRIGWGRVTLYGALKGNLPKRIGKFTADAERAVNGSRKMAAWMKSNGYEINDLLKADNIDVKKWSKPVGYGLKISRTH
ncbi:MAG: hypothetical protein JRD05_02000, partial [Deltaproteobacteria bacterium]|nr:hypothetical protein [Deltaproteobacteria bacterium]